jgi:hypothetical protein
VLSPLWVPPSACHMVSTKVAQDHHRTMIQVTQHRDVGMLRVNLFQHSSTLCAYFQISYLNLDFSFSKTGIQILAESLSLIHMEFMKDVMSAL